MHQTDPTLPRYGTDPLQVGVLTFERNASSKQEQDQISCSCLVPLLLIRGLLPAYD